LLSAKTYLSAKQKAFGTVLATAPSPAFYQAAKNPLASISTDNYLPKRKGHWGTSKSGGGFRIEHFCYPASDHCLPMSCM